MINIGGDLFDETIELYREQAVLLAKVAEIYPFDSSLYGNMNLRNENSVNAARLLMKASDIENKALESPYKIQAKL